jgi:hypothetical protein
MIDAGDLEQLFKAMPPVLAVLDFRKVDGAVEFPNRPAELNVVLRGKGHGWCMQYCGRKENRREISARLHSFHLLHAFSKMVMQIAGRQADIRA